MANKALFSGSRSSRYAKIYRVVAKIEAELNKFAAPFDCVGYVSDDGYYEEDLIAWWIGFRDDEDREKVTDFLWSIFQAYGIKETPNGSKFVPYTRERLKGEVDWVEPDGMHHTFCNISLAGGRDPIMNRMQDSDTMVEFRLFVPNENDSTEVLDFFRSLKVSDYFRSSRLYVGRADEGIEDFSGTMRLVSEGSNRGLHLDWGCRAEDVVFAIRDHEVKDIYYVIVLDDTYRMATNEEVHAAGASFGAEVAWSELAADMVKQSELDELLREDFVLRTKGNGTITLWVRS